jgi:hypothetical protein
MPRVRSVKQKVAAVAAVAVVLAGGSYAAMAATGQSSGHKGKRAHAAKSDLGVSAAYLGLSRSQLASDLQSGRTLAQVANATSGKSAEGLLEALVAAKKSKLAGAAETLTQRVTAEINRAGGPASGAGAGATRARVRARRGAPGLLGSAASYLGLTRKQLRAQLQSGASLAQLASSTPGRSPAGLIDALSQSKKARMAALVSAGKLTKAKQATRLERLTKRMTRVSKRKFAKHASA